MVYGYAQRIEDPTSIHYSCDSRRKKETEVENALPGETPAGATLDRWMQRGKTCLKALDRKVW